MYNERFKKLLFQPSQWNARYLPYTFYPYLEEPISQKILLCIWFYISKINIMARIEFFCLLKYKNYKNFRHWIRNFIENWPPCSYSGAKYSCQKVFFLVRIVSPRSYFFKNIVCHSNCKNIHKSILLYYHKFKQKLISTIKKLLIIYIRYDYLVETDKRKVKLIYIYKSYEILLIKLKSNKYNFVNFNWQKITILFK